MAMPDAVEAILRLMAAPRDRLSQIVYNVGAFAPSAAEVEMEVRAAFPPRPRSGRLGQLM